MRSTISSAHEGTEAKAHSSPHMARISEEFAVLSHEATALGTDSKGVRYQARLVTLR
jgi:hypothetical protein